MLTQGARIYVGALARADRPARQRLGALEYQLGEATVTGRGAGRKNHYDSKSLRGTEVAALFYTLLETARLWCEDPWRYLMRAALAAVDNPGTVTLPSSHD